MLLWCLSSKRHRSKYCLFGLFLSKIKHQDVMRLGFHIHQAVSLISYPMGWCPHVSVHACSMMSEVGPPETTQEVRLSFHLHVSQDIRFKIMHWVFFFYSWFSDLTWHTWGQRSNSRSSSMSTWHAQGSLTFWIQSRVDFCCYFFKWFILKIIISVWQHERPKNNPICC